MIYSHPLFHLSYSRKTNRRVLPVSSRPVPDPALTDQACQTPSTRTRTLRRGRQPRSAADEPGHRAGGHRMQETRDRVDRASVAHLTGGNSWKLERPRPTRSGWVVWFVSSRACGRSGTSTSSTRQPSWRLLEIDVTLTNKISPI